MKRSALKLNEEFELYGKKHIVLDIQYPNVIVQPLTGELKAQELNYYGLVTDKGFVQIHKNTEMSSGSKKFQSRMEFQGFIDSLSNEQSEKIRRKNEMIKPLLLLEKVKRNDPRAVIQFQERYFNKYFKDEDMSLDGVTQKELVSRIAAQFQVSTRTLERDLSKFKKEEQINRLGMSGLISEKVRYPHQRKDMKVLQICHPKKKEMVLCTIQSYLDERYLAILKQVIEQDYLTKKKASIREITDTVEIRCARAKLPVLSYDTVYSIVQRLDKEIVLRMRDGTASAQLYDPIVGNFSNTEAKSSLHIIEIDHTELDIILLDESTLEVLGRPWITLGIDVYSRCVWCMHISFDSPSGDKVRKAIEQGVLRKQVKETYGTVHEWEVYGIPDIIYFDNGKEFDNNQIKQLINETLESQVMYRPVANPRWGGTIERLFGTLNTKLIHRLAGTTKSNTKARGEYDSTKEAIYTLSDITELMTRYITDIYHHDIHASLPYDYCTPYKQYQRGLDIGGQNDFINEEDEETFHIELLPYKEVQFSRQGIRFGNVYYNDVELKRLIRNDGTKYKMKYDIDDISHVYILDVLTKEYIKVLAVNPTYETLIGMKKRTYKLLTSMARKKKKLRGNIPSDSDLTAAKDELLMKIEEMKKTNKGKIRVLKLGMEQEKKKIKPRKNFTLSEDDELLGLVKELDTRLEKGELSIEIE